MSLGLMWRMFLSSMTSTFTLNSWFAAYAVLQGRATEGINDPGLVTFGAVTGVPYRFWELPIFAMIAVVGGLLGALFNVLNIELTEVRAPPPLLAP